MNDPFFEIPCFQCSEGNLIETTIDGNFELPTGVKIIIPNVKVLRCDVCGDECVPPATSRGIERALERGEFNVIEGFETSNDSGIVGILNGDDTEI
jgi:YgiT-type zinc finger domain-containing protein